MYFFPPFFLLVGKFLTGSSPPEALSFEGLDSEARTVAFISFFFFFFFFLFAVERWGTGKVGVVSRFTNMLNNCDLWDEQLNTRLEWSQGE